MNAVQVSFFQIIGSRTAVMEVGFVLLLFSPLIMIGALIVFAITFVFIFVGTALGRHSGEYKENGWLAFIVATVSTLVYLITKYFK
ncbi:MAG TPA: hypothetical protein VK609_02180 [Mucilaginibacter sp.]|nr:hypothetical protein [Mucilaginibacter sp.]